MAKRPHTTNPSDEGNTIREMVYALENDLASLEGYSSLLLLAADGVMQHHGTEAGDGLIRLAMDTEACVDRLREWHRKAHKALGGQDEPEPAKPAEKAPSSTPEAKPTIRDLCRQWEIVQAKLNLDLLEESGEDTDRIIDAARVRFRAIEWAILATDPDTIRDADLVTMLRLARKVIGDDQFTPEQEERFQGMLELVDTVLVRRSDPADWDTTVQS